tara:strand:+ start:1052 stop:1261 length:210 start_codon:yes stop_codon:yes gene_type:complete
MNTTKNMKNLEKQIGKKILMKMTFSNHRGSLVEGEKVTLISLNEPRGEAEIKDPFGMDWTLPLQFLHIY